MADKVATIARPPQMRNFLTSSLKKHMIIAGIVSIASLVGYKVFIGDARKARYAEFYKTYDVEKAFEEIRKKGLFQSCK